MDASGGTTLSEAVRLCRGTLNQAEAARRIGRTQTWWSYVENGERRPNAEDLRALSREFDLSLYGGEWLIGRTPIRRADGF